MIMRTRFAHDGGGGNVIQFTSALSVMRKNDKTDFLKVTRVLS